MRTGSTTTRIQTFGVPCLPTWTPASRDVVHAHEQVVYAVALRLTRIPADAEDLAAEAFLRAYRALRGYDAPRIGRCGCGRGC